MQTPNTATPAIENDEPAFDVELLGGGLDISHTSSSTANIQDVLGEMIAARDAGSVAA
jgi:hypothetical protein